MKKNGFTLAEALITICIIGVVASLTLPTLQTNAMRQQVPTALAKAMTTLENGNKILMQREGVRDIFDVCGNTYLTCMRTQGILNGAAITPPTTVQNFSGQTKLLGLPEGLLTPDNLAYYSGGTWLQGSAPVGYRLRNTLVRVDVNGPAKGPNAFGKDIFTLTVNGSGAVIPHGGKLHSHVFSNGAAPSWETTCNSEKVSTAAAVEAGDSCAGSIVDNGYRIIYPF